MGQTPRLTNAPFVESWPTFSITSTLNICSDIIINEIIQSYIIICSDIIIYKIIQSYNIVLAIAKLTFYNSHSHWHHHQQIQHSPLRYQHPKNNNIYSNVITTLIFILGIIIDLNFNISSIIIIIIIIIIINILNFIYDIFIQKSFATSFGISSRT